MGFISKKTILDVLSQTLINLSSAWIGVVLVVPKLFGGPTLAEYLQSLTTNLPFGIVGLILAAWLSERSKKL